MQPVRWGVLGAANIAVKYVTPAMQASPLTPTIAIASRSREKATAAAERLGIPRAYGSYEDLLADPDVEAIYNPLPNHLHVPWTIRAADAGKHVLCEKPIAMSAAEARELVAARDRNGVQIAEAFMVRVHPRWNAVKELVDAGRIGQLVQIAGHFSYNMSSPANVRNVLEWGGGVLMDVGCYPIMLSRWMFGAEPTAVLADFERDPTFRVDRLTAGLMRFPSGQAVFTVGGQVNWHQRMQLIGTGGRIDLETPFTPGGDLATTARIEVGTSPAAANVELVEFPPVSQYMLQGEAFSRAVRGAGPVPVSLESAIGNMAVIDAMFRSEQSGRWESPADS